MLKKGHRPPRLRSRCRKGDLSEALFVAHAVRMGFNVCKPLNSDCPFDLMVEAMGRVTRVQLKSMWGKVHHNTYGVLVAQTRPRTVRGYRPYHPRTIDYFALYVAQEDAWYIVPRRAVGERLVVCLFPHRSKSKAKFEKYRDAWHLLLPKSIWLQDLKAMAEPE